MGKCTQRTQCIHSFSCAIALSNIIAILRIRTLHWSVHVLHLDTLFREFHRQGLKSHGQKKLDSHGNVIPITMGDHCHYHLEHSSCYHAAYYCWHQRLTPKVLGVGRHQRWPATKSRGFPFIMADTSFAKTPQGTTFRAPTAKRYKPANMICKIHAGLWESRPHARHRLLSRWCLDRSINWR